MSYKIYMNKGNIFEAKINIKGASLKKSTCRIIIESPEYNIMYEGTIDSKGNCKIPIKKIKNVLSEGTVGSIKLEVIAEDTYFKPWEDNFVVTSSKSVQVEVKQENKPIDLIKEDKKSHLKGFVKQLLSEGITLKNIKKNKNRISELSNDLIFKHNISEDERKWILENTLKILIKKNK